MRQYVARRLLQIVPVIIGASVLIFALMRVLPGDVAATILIGPGGGGIPSLAELEKLRQQLGLHDPLWRQYLEWVRQVFTLDLGKSVIRGVPVLGEIRGAIGTSLELGVLSVGWALLIGLASGVISAVKQDTWIDYVVRVLTLGGIAIPSFWLASLFILVSATVFQWMPPVNYETFTQSPLGNLAQMVWPALVLGYYFAGVTSRITRSMMLEVLNQDFIRTARAKGLVERTVLVRHALGNALLPVVTLSGIQIGVVLGGVVIIEWIFSVPGLGGLLVDSMTSRDYPLVQNIVLLMACFFVFMNLFVDVLYAYLDPRIKYA